MIDGIYSPRLRARAPSSPHLLVPLQPSSSSPPRQAVDFALPTTPTNTAHYAIVPPPAPTLSPSGAFSSSAHPAGNRMSSSGGAGAGHWPNSGSTGGGGDRGAALAATMATREHPRPASPSPSSSAVAGVARCSAGGVVGDEEGLSAKESRSARRAHRSALLTVPPSILSPRPTTRTANHRDACSDRGNGCLGGGGGGGGGADVGRRWDGAAPRGCTLATELTLPQAHPLDATPTPPTSPDSPGLVASGATGDDRLADEDCSRRGNCGRPRQAAAAPASVLPPYDGNSAGIVSVSAGGASTVVNSDAASCGRMCTLWPLEAAKQAAGAMAGAAVVPGSGAGAGGRAGMGYGKAAVPSAQTTPVPAKTLKECGEGSSDLGGRGKMRTVAMRSSAGQEFATLR